MSVRKRVRRLCQRLVGPGQPPVHRVRITRAQEIPPLLNWAENKTILRLELATELLTMQGAFTYAGGWHPFVAALRYGAEALRWFYATHAPATLGESYFLDVQTTGSDLPPWELPWLFRLERNPPPGEAGLAAEHGVSFYGPATADKVRVEAARLSETARSVQQNGYLPDRFGDIQGCFFRRGEDFRFFVRGGKHRAAVLAFLGYTHIPVTFKPAWPRCVDGSDARDWPLVRSGAASPELARMVFDRYFDFNGVQQRDRLVRSTPPTTPI